MVNKMSLFEKCDINVPRYFFWFLCLNDIRKSFSIYNVRQPVRRAYEFLLGTVKM